MDIANKFLKIREGVILTEIIAPKIIALDAYFEAENCIGWVTSGLRRPEDQLRIIRQYLTKKGMDKYYPSAMNMGVADKVIQDGVNVYSWQMGWSALLNAGIIINPCMEAVCLMDYISGGVNKKGQTFQPSVHFVGKAFDIGGGADGIDG